MGLNVLALRRSANVSAYTKDTVVSYTTGKCKCGLLNRASVFNNGGVNGGIAGPPSELGGVESAAVNEVDEPNVRKEERVPVHSEWSQDRNLTVCGAVFREPTSYSFEDRWVSRLV
jgi:hypothetical protein